jgi:hypothetical protein
VITWAFAAALTSLAGCGSGRTDYVSLGQKYQSRPLSAKEARVVVLWPTDAMFGSGVQPRVLVNGIDVGKLEPLGYLDAIVEPGEATIAVRYKAMSDGRMVEAAKNLAVATRPGGEAFVEYGMKSGFFAPELTLQELPAEAGRQKAALVRKTVQN